MAYSIVTVLSDGSQLTASGYEKLEAAIAHVRERVRIEGLRDAGLTLPTNRCFVIVGPDGQTVVMDRGGQSAPSGRNQIQAWYAQERRAT